MIYDEARAHIETGDLIAIRRRSGPLAVATRLVTDSPYTHTGVALWVGPPGTRRLLLVQMNGGGANLIPLSQEAEFAFDVFDCPIERSRVVEAIWATLGTRLTYSVGDLLRILLFVRFGVPLPAQGEDYICSALSAYLYKLAGWLPRKLPSIPWPGAVVAALESSPKVEVRP